ncbi:c-type cytochrome [Paraburkholderia pallida]|uniref:C-type cytochrome n=1 Tax=Paraburkholderia pallida TaxID=2547399 RepID=A0A4P7D7E0_9BURK|nr:c-type cytochrome [Paraburkholderia pallida]QBR02644.1 c-type cytochrome [Paraburkholderia pallida]
MKRYSVLSRIVSNVFVAGVLLLPAVAVRAQEDTTRVHELVTARCAACHGVDGNSTASAYPRLAGQFPGYLQQQLEMFKRLDGRPPMRHSPVMESMVADLSDADIRALAAYYAAQAPNNQREVVTSSSALGERVYTGGASGGAPACAVCHGVDGAGVAGLFPRLAGQHPEYVGAQLENYKNGRRGGKGRAMTTIGPLLSDDEIKAVAAYIGSLKPQ